MEDKRENLASGSVGKLYFQKKRDFLFFPASSGEEPQGQWTEEANQPRGGPWAEGREQLVAAQTTGEHCLLLRTPRGGNQGAGVLRWFGLPTN